MGEPIGRGPGRPAASSREEIERGAMRLFLERGYAETTIAMIASESEVSRMSVFRYWGSKSDIVWAPFDEHTRILTRRLAESDSGIAIMTAILDAAVESLIDSARDSASWLERFAVFESSESLRAEEAGRWRVWAEAVAHFVSERRGVDDADIVSQSIGGAMQAAFFTILRGRLEQHASALPDRRATRQMLTPLATVLQRWLDAGA